MKYSNVLVEVVMADKVEFSDIVPVFDHSTGNLIGKASLKYKDDCIYADIESSIEINGMYPFLDIKMSRIKKGYGLVTGIFVCNEKDVDERIVAIKHSDYTPNKSVLSDNELDDLYKDEGKSTDRYHR